MNKNKLTVEVNFNINDLINTKPNDIIYFLSCLEAINHNTFFNFFNYFSTMLNKDISKEQLSTIAKYLYDITVIYPINCDKNIIAKCVGIKLIIEEYLKKNVFFENDNLKSKINVKRNK